jgi:FkbM family methyltransferase
MKIKTVTDRLRGLVANFRFTNGIYITYNRLFRRNVPALTYIWKNRLFITCNCALRDHIPVQEIFAEGMYRRFLNRCGLSHQVRYVNVGANIGAFDLWLLDLGKRIESSLAVELNPLTYQRCLVNFQTNGLTTTRLLNCGIAGEDGSILFRPSAISIGDSIYTMSSPGQAGNPTQQVEILTLATLLARHAPDNAEFDLLKLDCEATEYAILRLTAIEVLRRFRNILIEFHPEPPEESVDRAYSRLQEAGFRSLRGRPGQFLFVDMFSRT